MIDSHRKIFVTGGAGFIGSHLVDRLLKSGREVVVYDNFSTGFDEFLSNSVRNPSCRIVRGDLLETTRLSEAMVGADFVFHLAANADVRFGLEQPRKDLEQNTVATFNVLEAMRANGISRIAFSSTGSIYGEASVTPTPEDAPFPVQTSLYGASKLACEGLIQAYCEGFGFRAWIFRFVSVLGERYSHGHVFDFYKKLLENPDEMHVLGDGKQKKSYIYVQDCLDAIFTAVDNASDKVNLFNLGVDDYCLVNDSIGWITEELGLSPRLIHSGGDRGWVGDNPFIYLDCGRIRELGWRPGVSIKDGILCTLRYLRENPWLLERR
ncbi:NAD-dependent epimerase/dehydratase family protein [Nitrospinota bacterium]